MAIRNFFRKICNLLKGYQTTPQPQNTVENISLSTKNLTQSLTEQAKATANADYQQHIDNINSFDINHPIKTDNNPLTDIEKAFLKYIAGRKVNTPNIAGYWSYEYKIDFNYTVSKYINNNYLYIGSADPSKLTTSALKKILQLAGLPAFGKKAELVARVQELPTSTYSTELYYCLTEKGRNTINPVQENPTKAISFYYKQPSTTNSDIKTKLQNYNPEDEYQILCALDDKTCPICGKMDLCHFKYKQAKVGKNYPPFHQGCRCTTIPYFADEDNDTAERIAKDKEGKTIYVDEKMTWTNWKKIYGKN